MSIPATQKEWRVQGKNGPDSLIFNASASVPKLGDKDVLVKCTSRPPRQGTDTAN